MSRVAIEVNDIILNSKLLSRNIYVLDLSKQIGNTRILTIHLINSLQFIQIQEQSLNLAKFINVINIKSLSRLNTNLKHFLVCLEIYNRARLFSLWKMLQISIIADNQPFDCTTLSLSPNCACMVSCACFLDNLYYQFRESAITAKVKLLTPLAMTRFEPRIEPITSPCMQRSRVIHLFC